MCDYMYMYHVCDILKRHKIVTLRLSGPEDVGRGLTEKRYKRNFGGDENIVYFHCSSGYAALVPIEVYQMSYVKKIKFIAYKSYFTKSNF